MPFLYIFLAGGLWVLYSAINSGRYLKAVLLGLGCLAIVAMLPAAHRDWRKSRKKK